MKSLKNYSTTRIQSQLTIRHTFADSLQPKITNTQGPRVTGLFPFKELKLFTFTYTPVKTIKFKKMSAILPPYLNHKPQNKH